MAMNVQGWNFRLVQQVLLSLLTNDLNRLVNDKGGISLIVGVASAEVLVWQLLDLLLHSTLMMVLAFRVNSQTRTIL